ncbi:hypothetical protein SynBIOSE41_00156 [Synechococcus sp. BIOS-E4-1]|nr:hypothetical protein SynBIOSE41_00156 [Synechococcus sp. BIOS-E4-1]
MLISQINIFTDLLLTSTAVSFLSARVLARQAFFMFIV